VKFRALPTLL